METTLTKKLGSRIKELRKAKGINQCKMADLLEMERSNYTRIENGKQSPADKNLEKIASILNVGINELFDFEHIKTREELVNAINELVSELTEKELMYFYKSLLNLKIMR